MVELSYSAVSVQSLCESALPIVEQQARKKQIALTVEVPPELGMMTVDERRMRQVLVNLLSNAVKFTPEGGSVTVTAFRGEAGVKAGPPPDAAAETLCIAVTDTGIGISPEDADRLFQPFVQVDSSLNRRHQGTGLGLALVKHFVELHGGTVSIASQPGQGSCFTVCLPRAPQAVEASGAALPAVAANL